MLNLPHCCLYSSRFHSHSRRSKRSSRCLLESFFLLFAFILTVFVVHFLAVSVGRLPAHFLSAVFSLFYWPSSKLLAICWPSFLDFCQQSSCCFYRPSSCCFYRPSFCCFISHLLAVFIGHLLAVFYRPSSRCFYWPSSRCFYRPSSCCFSRLFFSSFFHSSHHFFHCSNSFSFRSFKFRFSGSRFPITR